MKSTCYHMRNQDGTKAVGGSIDLSGDGPDLNRAAEDLIVRSDIRVMPSGRLSFYHNGKPVYAYLLVDPAESEKGRAILKAHAEAKEEKERIEAGVRADQQKELNDLIDNLGTALALTILKRIKKDEQL